MSKFHLNEGAGANAPVTPPHAAVLRYATRDVGGSVREIQACADCEWVFSPDGDGSLDGFLAAAAEHRKTEAE